MFLEKASTEVIADDSMHFQSVVKSFKEYRNHSVYVNNQRKADLPKLSIEHQALLKPYAMKLGIPFDLWIIDSINLCASKNQIFLTEMIKDELSPEVDQQIASGSNVEKVRSTLRQFVRDWAVEGEEERKGCYTPILQALEEEFDDIPVDNRDAIRILVPGAGLGRLAYEIARRNFSCEGNEFSFHCLIASNYIFNKVLEKESVKIYPWIHNLSNHCWTEDMLRAVSFPDVVPTDELQGTTSDFSMTAVYSKEAQKGQWDSVVTCFFIDTAHNIIEYAETISHCLKPGGVWINLGPMLWHHEGTKDGVSISLSYDELKDVLKAMGGWRFEQETTCRSTYSTSKTSMMRNVYDSKFFVARKV